MCQDRELAQMSVRVAGVRTWTNYVTALFNDQRATLLDQEFIKNAQIQIGIQFKAIQVHIF